MRAPNGGVGRRVFPPRQRAQNDTAHLAAIGGMSARSQLMRGTPATRRGTAAKSPREPGRHGGRALNREGVQGGRCLELLAATGPGS
jgi:hypothetical protein